MENKNLFIGSLIYGILLAVLGVLFLVVSLADNNPIAFLQFIFAGVVAVLMLIGSFGVKSQKSFAKTVLLIAGILSAPVGLIIAFYATKLDKKEKKETAAQSQSKYDFRTKCFLVFVAFSLLGFLNAVFFGRVFLSLFLPLILYTIGAIFLLMKKPWGWILVSIGAVITFINPFWVGYEGPSGIVLTFWKNLSTQDIIGAFLDILFSIFSIVLLWYSISNYRSQKKEYDQHIDFRNGIIFMVAMIFNLKGLLVNVVTGTVYNLTRDIVWMALFVFAVILWHKLSEKKRFN